MSSATESRLRELDAVLDGVVSQPHLSEELVAVVDALDSTPALRRALSDPAADEAAKNDLVDSLFGARVSGAAVAVLKAAAGRRWGSPRRLADALERQAVRAELVQAYHAGSLDEVADELFQFGRAVAGSDQLREALADRLAPLAARQQVAQTLLDGRATPATVRLAVRAVKARERTVALTLERYARTAAEVRDRLVAKVTVARPLTEEQVTRLRSSLDRLAGRRVDIQVSTDPQVLGGMRVHLGDEVIEGTVAHRLDDARRQIA